MSPEKEKSGFGNEVSTRHELIPPQVRTTSGGLLIGVLILLEAKRGIRRSGTPTNYHHSAFISMGFLLSIDFPQSIDFKWRHIILISFETKKKVFVIIGEMQCKQTEH